MRPFFVLGLVAALATWSHAVAESASAGQRFSSGANRVSLIELFTSEGCSSCPPAEQWMSTLRDDSGLWRDYVPVQFHVNYWDRLGWKDRFASKEATEREYGYSAAWSSHSVYTPCVVRDGAESRTSATLPRSREESPGELTVTVDGAGLLHVEFAAVPGFAGASAGYDVHVALIGSGFMSRVTAGENRGETLRHEFVACGLTLQKLTASPDGIYRAELALPKSRVTDIPQRGIAAWIVKHGDIKPLQATGGWLDAK